MVFRDIMPLKVTTGYFQVRLIANVGGGVGPVFGMVDNGVDDLEWQTQGRFEHCLDDEDIFDGRLVIFGDVL